MTCIAGVAEGGKVHIGGDSAGVSGWSLRIRADEKVFRNGPFLMGFTTSFRMGQLLRFAFKPPKQTSDDDFCFMVTEFIDAIRNCLKAGGYASKSNEQESGGTFLVGYRGRLYDVNDDYQVGVVRDGIAAVGCGDQIAMGAMSVLGNEEPRQRVLKALKAAERFSAGVRGPFVVKSL